MKIIVTLAVALLVGSSQLRSQDIHFTLFEMMPVVFNPAETGNFYGSYRVSGIYRDQWVSITGFPDEFKTPALSVDAPIIKGFRDQDWVGVGGFFYSDKSGSLGLVNNAFKLSAAYHLGLNKKGTAVISFGYQTGSVARRIKASGLAKIELESDDYEPGSLTGDLALMGISELQKSYLDHVGGINFKARPNRTDVIEFGLAVGNIGSPDASLLGGGGGGMNPGPNPPPSSGRFESPLRFIGTASYRFALNSEFALKPTAFYQRLGPASELAIQVGGEYLLNAEKQTVLRAGLGYRVGDALQLIVGMDFKQSLQVTFGYDVNVSQLSPASNAVGGFELSAVYIGKIYKRPDPEPVLFCPRF